MKDEVPEPERHSDHSSNLGSPVLQEILESAKPIRYCDESESLNPRLPVPLRWPRRRAGPAVCSINRSARQTTEQVKPDPLPAGRGAPTTCAPSYCLDGAVARDYPQTVRARFDVVAVGLLDTPCQRSGAQPWVEHERRVRALSERAVIAGSRAVGHPAGAPRAEYSIEREHASRVSRATRSARTRVSLSLSPESRRMYERPASSS